MVENKQTYFWLKIKLTEKIRKVSKEDKDSIQEKIDLLYSRLKVGNTVYQCQKDNVIIYLFKCDQRKRLGQVTTLLSKIFTNGSIVVSWEAKGILKPDFELMVYNYITNVKKSQYQVTKIPENFPGYSRADIEMLDDEFNWRDWQRDLMKILFIGGVTGVPKKPDPRAIIFIRDIEGNSGKSTFVKWLITKRDDVAQLSFGTASQLRSYIIGGGAFPIFILDMPRAVTETTNWRSADVLCSIELTKSGLISSAMHGQTKTLVMDVPNIIIFGNQFLDFKQLSADRWIVYDLKKNRLKKVNLKGVAIKK